MTKIAFVILIAVIFCVIDKTLSFNELKCDGEYLDLYCGANQKIKIGNAFYGRNEVHKCSMSSVIDCSSSSALGILQQKCNDKQNCKVKVGVRTFGDPCKFVPKYLSVDYVCEEETPPQEKS